MTTTLKRVAWVDLGNVLTTELNSLGNGSFSALGTAYDNSSGLYVLGRLVFTLASLNPTAGAYVQPFMVPAVDGTNYDDAPSSTQPGGHHLLPFVNLATGAATKLASTPAFDLSPDKLKFNCLNGAGVAFGATLNTVKLWGGYLQNV
jgi:hypothetical protein